MRTLLFFLSLSLSLAANALQWQGYSWDEEGPFLLEKVREAVKLTPSGKILMGKIEKIPLYSTESRLALSYGSQPGIAGFFYDGKIFIDESLSFLACAVTLYHEAVHALNPATDLITAIDGEKKAYEGQDRFLKELIELNPAFKSVIEKLVSKREIFNFPTSEHDLRLILTRGMKMPKEDVDAYFNSRR